MGLGQNGVAPPGVTIDDAVEVGQVVAVYPTEDGLLGASDGGGPSGGIGLRSGDHIEGQETLSAAWRPGLHREASQISRGVALGAQIGSNHCYLRVGGGKRHVQRVLRHEGYPSPNFLGAFGICTRYEHALTRRSRLDGRDCLRSVDPFLKNPAHLIDFIGGIHFVRRESGQQQEIKHDPQTWP